MREMWEMWPDQEDINRGHKFRGLGGLPVVQGNHTWANDVDPLSPPPKPEVEDEDSEKIKERELTSLLSRRDAIPESHENLHGARDASTPTIEDDDEPSPAALQPGPIDDGDIHVFFLFMHFVVERSREGMLWSWIVATIGGDHDQFGVAQRNEAWRVLVEDAQAVQQDKGVLEVIVKKRKTMEPWRVQWALDQVEDTLKASKYRFCELLFFSFPFRFYSISHLLFLLTGLFLLLASQDGYAYSFYDEKRGLEWWHDSTYWPCLFDDDNFRGEAHEQPNWTRCTIDWNVCFPDGMNSASEIFKNIAYREPKCGDCSTYTSSYSTGHCFRHIC